MPSPLPQDAAQASQAANIIAEREYRAELAQYEQDKKDFEKNEIKRIENEKKAAAQRVVDAKAADIAAFEKESNVGLDRSTADYINKGWGSASSFNPEQKLMVAKAEARRDVSTGKITTQEGLQRIGVASDLWAAEAAQRTTTVAASAAKTFQSRRLDGTLNSEVRTSQVTELQRLGGSGSLQSGNTGPTMISETLVRDTPSVAKRATVAPGVAARSQPFPDSFKSKAELGIKQNVPSTPESRWAEIATPGVGMFSGIEQKPTYSEPTEKGFSKPVSPYIQGSYVGYSPEGKAVQGPPKVEGSYIGYSPEGKAIQGAPRQRYTVGDKTFNSLDHAERYVERTSNFSSPVVPFVSLGGFAVAATAAAETEKYGRSFLGNLEESARYSEKLDKEKRKPVGLLESVQYYASQGVKPILDLGYEAKGLITGQEQEITPEITATMFDQAIQKGKDAWSVIQNPKSASFQGTALQGENKLFKYVADDPLRTIVQTPAQVGLWRSGGFLVKKLLEGGGKIIPIALKSASVEGETIYRGLTFANKPVIGIAKNKIVIGAPKNKIPELSEAALKDRNAGELAEGRGLEKNLFYNERVLNEQVSSGYINPLSKERATALVELETSAQKSKGDVFVGNVGEDSFKTGSQEQGDFLLKTAERLNKENSLEALHGSLATRVQTSPAIQAEAGDVLKMGDIDYSIKLTAKEAKGLTPQQQITAIDKKSLREAERLKKEFPTGEGETLRIDASPGKNKGLVLTRTIEGKTSEQKIAEFVVEKSSQSQKLGDKSATHILGFKKPEGTVTALDYNIKTKTLSYQGLTQTKTGLAYQKFEISGGGPLDSKARAMIYPAEGRAEKDIVRRYWIGKQQSVNQITSGRTILGKETDVAAEKVKSLYPEFNFAKVQPEKVKINMSSGDASVTSGTSPTPLPLLQVRGGSTQQNNPNITPSRVSPSVTSGTSPTPLPLLQVRGGSTQQNNPNITPSRVSPSVRTPSVRSVTPSRVSPSVRSVTPSLRSTPTSLRSVIPSVRSVTPSRISPSLKTPSLKTPSKGASSVKSPPPSVKPPPSIKSPPPSLRSPPSVKSPPSIKSPPPSLRSPPSIKSPPTKNRPPQIPPIRRAPPIAVLIKNTERKSLKPKNKQNDFLGNTKLDSIEGLFRRSTIIHGDKRISKQVRKDKKAKFKERGVSFFSKR